MGRFTTQYFQNVIYIFENTHFYVEKLQVRLHQKNLKNFPSDIISISETLL